MNQDKKANTLELIIISSFIGWFLAAISESLVISYIVAIGTLFLLTRWLYVYFFDRTNLTHFLKLGAVSLLVFQNLAWITASYMHLIVLKRDIRVSLSSSFDGVSLYTYAISYSFITLFCLVLSFLANHKKIVMLESILYQKLKALPSIPLKKIKRILWSIFFIQLYLILSGVIGQRTIVTSGYDEGKIPFWLPFVTSLFFVYKIFLVVYFIKLKSLNFYRTIEFILFLAPTLFISFTKGRGAFIFTLLYFLFWFLLLGGRVKLKALLIGVLLLPVLSALLVFNNYLRNADKSLSAVDVISVAYKEYSSSDTIIKESKEKSINNTATRPLVLMPLAACISNVHGTFTLGENIINSFVWVIPSQIVSNKSDFPVQEALLNQHFNLGAIDTADSLPLYAYTEFSWFGILIYPLLIFVIWFIILIINFMIKFSPLFVTLSMGSFSYLLFFRLGESSLVAWFDCMRSIVFFALLISSLNTLKILK